MKLSALSSIVAAPIAGLFMNASAHAENMSAEDFMKLEAFYICVDKSLSTTSLQMPSDEQLSQIGKTGQEVYDMLYESAVVDAAEECAAENGLGFQRTPDKETKFNLIFGYPMA